MNINIIYRKRVIPNECIKLDSDIIIYQTDDMVFTKWHAFHEKPYLSYGYSCYFLNEGYKLSKFIRSDGTFSVWYFDIVSYSKGPEEDSLLVQDLLADVVVNADGTVRVVDLDELAQALEEGLITSIQMCTCLKQLHVLLDKLYHNGLQDIIIPLENAISQIN